MIKQIIVLRREIVRACLELGRSPIGDNGKPWYLISIFSDEEGGSEGPVITNDNRSTLAHISCKGFLSMRFWDITDKDMGDIFKRAFPDCKLFDQEQAEEIIEFLDSIKEKKENAILVVQCAAGISRSGAVGEFANEYLGLSCQDFFKTNPHINSNGYVLRLLKEVSDITPMEQSYDVV